MPWHRHLRSGRAAVVAAVVVGLAGGAFATAAIPDRKGEIRACYSKKRGSLRVSSSGRCKRTERKLTFNQRGRAGARGAAGPPGPAGARGPTGPSAGAAVVPVASVTNSTVQAQGELAFNQEVVDTANMHSGSSARLVAPVRGVYEARAIVAFAVGASGSNFSATLRVNSGTPIDADSTLAGDPVTSYLRMGGVRTLNAGDYVSVTASSQNAGDLAYTCAPGPECPTLSLRWVSAAP